MTIRFDQSEHDKLLLIALNKLKEEGFSEVKAECVDYDKPELLYAKEIKEGYSPDITAIKEGREYIIEVETEDSIFTGVTEKQWKTFSENAEYYDKKFIVIIKKDLENEARRQSDYLKVKPEFWTI